MIVYVPPLLLAHEIAGSLASLRWGIGGSLLLFRLGLVAAPRDLDIVTTIEDFGELSARLSLLFGAGRPAPHPTYASIHFSRFVAADDSSIDVMAGVRVRGPAGLVHWHFNPETVAEVDGLPWMRAEDWLRLYELFERPERVRLLAEYLKISKTVGDE